MANIMPEPPSKRSKTGGDAGPSTERANPYLAHLGPQSQSNGAATGSNGNGVGAATGKNPLNGLVPRMVTTEQAKNILVSYPALTSSNVKADRQDGDVNPFKNQQPFSANYKKILEQRKGLPVYQKMTEFLEVFSKNQITVMEGQTGSGKTTQIPQFVCDCDLPML
jgi:pre-mRNA-splicing factor ATP-dependent RNA helicase DHX15/PRP43